MLGLGRQQKLVGWVTAALALLLVVLLSISQGQLPISFADVLHSLLSRLMGTPSGLPENIEVVLWNIRLPRIGAACFVGAVLGTTGAAYQGMFRNPLVSPDILSVSTGASLGAVLAIYLGWSLLGVQCLAFLGGLLAVASVVRIATQVDHREPVLALVLSGIAISSLLGAGISLLKVLADPYSQLPAITFWMMGGLGAVTGADLAATVPAMLLGLVPLLLLRWRMNLLCLSDEEATSLGEDVPRLRRILIASATLSCAASVSLSGTIAWVGLVIPHSCRLLVGPNYSQLLPASALMGAGFLTATDTLARCVAEIEIPIGVLTSLLGAPFFLALLARSAREY